MRQKAGRLRIGASGYQGCARSVDRLVTPSNEVLPYTSMRYAPHNLQRTIFKMAGAIGPRPATGGASPPPKAG
jgi:hypothetical protein